MNTLSSPRKPSGEISAKEIILPNQDNNENMKLYIYRYRNKKKSKSTATELYSIRFYRLLILLFLGSSAVLSDYSDLRMIPKHQNDKDIDYIQYKEEKNATIQLAFLSSKIQRYA